MESEPPSLPNKIEESPKRVTAEVLAETKRVIPVNGINYMPPTKVIFLGSKLYEDIYLSNNDYVYFNPISYAGINGYFIDWHDELFLSIEETFRLGRLAGIRQLSLIRGAGVLEGESEFLTGFSHTRYNHSYNVLAIAVLLARNLGLSEENGRLLRLAALTHDYRTPAGGDTTKQADPEFFDEDKHYNEIFKKKEWRDFAEKYGISSKEEEQLHQIILGQGILGQLLDIADKIAYVAHDLGHYLFKVVKWATIEGKGSSGFEEIKRLFEDTPSAGDFWGSIEIIDGKAVVGDAESLRHFLEMRARLWKYLYENFEGGFSIALLAKNIIRHLLNSGRLSRDFLLDETDSKLFEILAEFLGIKSFPSLIISFKHTRQDFSNMEEALSHAKQYDQDPGRIAVVDKATTATSSGTNKFFVKKDGKAVPFSEAYPNEAQEIDRTLTPSNVVKVYMVNLQDLGIPESHWARVKEVFSAASSPA